MCGARHPSNIRSSSSRKRGTQSSRREQAVLDSYAGCVEDSRMRFALTTAAAPHRSKISPLLHDPAIRQPAYAVLATRTLTDLALAAALCTEYRCRSPERPRTLPTNE